MIFAQYKVKLGHILQSMYIFWCFYEVSAIRKPKIITFTITGSQIFFADFVFSTKTKRYSAYRKTVNNTTPNQCPYYIPTFYTLLFLRYSPNKILKVKVTTARSKVKSRSHHDIAYLHPLRNVPKKYQLPKPYTF